MTNNRHPQAPGQAVVPSIREKTRHPELPLRDETERNELEPYAPGHSTNPESPSTQTLDATPIPTDEVTALVSDAIARMDAKGDPFGIRAGNASTVSQELTAQLTGKEIPVLCGLLAEGPKKQNVHDENWIRALRALLLLHFAAERIDAEDLALDLMNALAPWFGAPLLHEYAIGIVRRLHASNHHKVECLERVFADSENQGQLRPGQWGHLAQAIVDFATTPSLRDRALEAILAFVARDTNTATILAVLTPLGAIAAPQGSIAPRKPVPHGIEILEHAPEAYAPTFIKLLIQMDDITVAPRIVELFESPPGPATEAAALDYIRAFGYRPAARRFIQKLSMKPPNVARVMARILADWKADNAYGAIKDLLERFRGGGETTLIVDVFCSARRLAVNDQLPYLAGFLRAATPEVRRGVKKALGENQPESINQALAAE
jgi:hypothetical protein